MKVYNYAKENDLFVQSAIKEKEFREFFKTINIKTVVEIGTYRGVSAAYIAQFAKKVFTFDIVDWEEKYRVWYELGVGDRIRYFTIKDREDIRKVLGGIDFDFAFIDGKHTYEDVKADFELLKRCGRVLFHDVAKRKNYGLRRFVKRIEAKIEGNIAYWESR
ncbi:MAG: class I SAM-dependent methyltransferase [Candidatus Heimdallarchaeaceae archaeon]